MFIIDDGKGESWEVFVRSMEYYEGDSKIFIFSINICSIFWRIIIIRSKWWWYRWSCFGRGLCKVGWDEEWRFLEKICWKSEDGFFN